MMNRDQNLKIQSQFYKYKFMYKRLKTINTEYRRKTLFNFGQPCRYKINSRQAFRRLEMPFSISVLWASYGPVMVIHKIDHYKLLYG